MKTFDWNVLDDSERRAALARPIQQRQDAIRTAVARILEQVRADGDSSLRALTRRYDGCQLGDLRVSEDEFAAAAAHVPAEVQAAIEQARLRIERFHLAGRVGDYAVETAPGVRCERIIRPLDRVGMYVPAGSAPLPSTALMLGVPAKLAGVGEVVLCTPANADGEVEPVTLVAARQCGIHQVFKLGGAQAIAAMAFGTESVPRCDKLFGPGNAYVTEAKLQLAADPDGVAIDMPAGPSELMVIADRHAKPAWVAADLLSQAEHGVDSQVILVSDDAALLDAVPGEAERQLADLPRAEIARAALQHARLIRVDDLLQAVIVANRYAPEHLILNCREPRSLLPAISAAGSVFLGSYTAEALGDYCSGTNHVLPTYGAARAYSGVSVASFQRWISVQEVSRDGLREIGPCAVTLARAERLEAHALAVERRLRDREIAL